MKSSATILVILMAVATGVSALAADAVPASLISEKYDQLSPAICVVKFSSEVTNPNSGEVTKRDTRALGIIVSADGLVISHGHMKLDNKEPFNISVTVGHGEGEEVYDATLLEKPDDVNIAFLRIESEESLKLSYLRFADRKLKVGEPVMLLGVLGATLDYAPSIATRRIGSILDKPRTTYCIDERLSFGFVGSPALNAKGEAVGVVGFDLSSGEGGDLYTRSGHPLVYQTSLFKSYIDSPPGAEEDKDETDDAFIGIFSQPLTDDLAEYWGLPQDGGIVVGTVIPSSPASLAGLKHGDVLTNFDGNRLKAKADREVVTFTKLVREAGIGAEVPVKLLRDGEPLEVTVTLAGRPKSARDATEFEDETFGLTVRELTQDVRILLNLEESVNGVIVRRVRSGSYAALARMRPGVIILNFNNQPVSNIDDFKAAIQSTVEAKPKDIPVFCRVGPRTVFFRMQPRWEE